VNARFRSNTAILVFWASVAAPMAAEESASLRIRWSPSPVERSEKISLLPIDVTLPGGLTRDDAVRMWSRAITGTGQRWDLLPPGTYQIVVRAGSAAPGMSVPVEVGEVILGPGDDRTVPIVLPPEATSEHPPAGTLRVLIPKAEVMPESLRVSQWRDGVRSKLDATHRQVSDGTLLPMPASCVAGSVVMIESSTALGTAILERICDDPVRIPLVDRATVTTRIAVPRGSQTPRSGSLRFTKCVDAAPMEVPFAISESRMRTSVPAGCSEMTLRVAGFAPVRLSPQPLKADESRDLGTIALLEGAAAVFRVRAGRDAIPLEGVQITALRPSELSSMRGQLDADPVTLGTTVSDASGWARLIGLPEGRLIFLLQARGRKRPQVSEPYELEAGEETVIDDLVVETPANVFVTVSVPPHLENVVELHAVELTGTGHTHWPSRVPMRAEAGPTGTVVEDVPPGTWIVRATGRLKNGFALRLAETTIDVAPGVDRHVTLTLTDMLFHGRVTRGGKAISGSINLKPADRESRLRTAVAKVGRDGQFQVLLEGKGQYAVSVQDSGHRSVKLGRYVIFEDPDDEIEIELPTGREIRGRVVDSTGSPVEGVSVGATQQIAEPAGAVGVRSSADGRFVLDGVVPGRWKLTAESKNERSEPVILAVGESDLDGITLVVDPVQTIKIRVVDLTGAPLPMVNVTIEFLTPGAEQPQLYGNLTGGRGEVEIRLSPAQQTIPTSVVSHTAPDGRLSCEMRRLDSDQTIQISPHGGEVRLIARRWVRKAGANNWLVSSSGCAVPFYAKVEQESDGQQAMVFRRLATGTWTYVETHNAQELAAVLTGRGLSLPSIKTFVVQSGKTTRVAVP